MFSHTKKSLYRILGGRMYLDLSLHSTLEPHAEKLKLDNVQVDKSIKGIVLPMESMVNGERVHLLKEIFKSWPRYYHQTEFEKTYLGGGKISVLELGPFELHIKGHCRPATCNVQFSPSMSSDGQTVRIGTDIMSRAHYLIPELMSGGLSPIHNNSQIAPIGSVPLPSEGNQRAPNRLYRDDAIRSGWTVIDGNIVSNPSYPIPEKQRTLVEQQWETRMSTPTQQSVQKPDTTTSQTPRVKVTGRNIFKQSAL